MLFVSPIDSLNILSNFLTQRRWVRVHTLVDSDHLEPKSAHFRLPKSGGSRYLNLFIWPALSELLTQKFWVIWPQKFIWSVFLDKQKAIALWQTANGSLSVGCLIADSLFNHIEPGLSLQTTSCGPQRFLQKESYKTDSMCNTLCIYRSFSLKRKIVIDCRFIAKNTWLDFVE